MYSVWMKVDETLPWIELKGDYSTSNDARNAAKEALKKVCIKIVNMPEKKIPLRALVTVKRRPKQRR